MKTTLLTMLVALLLGGCVTATYNPVTKELKYERIGDQKMSGVIVEMYPDGRVDVLLEAQQSEARMFQDALRLIEKGIEIGRKRCGDTMINVLPVEDWIDHTEDTTCICQPEVIFENGEMIIIHQRG